MTQTPRRFPIGWIAVAIIVLITAVLLILPRIGGVDVFGIGGKARQTAEVGQMTVVTTVDTTGTVEPNQSVVLFWKTTGEVAEVTVQVGDQVAAGDLLMALDPATTPPNIIGAQVELIAAQEALSNLLNPSTTSVMTTESTVADGFLALAQAEAEMQQLIDLTNGVDTELDRAVTDTLDALNDARDQYPLASAELDAQMLYRAIRMTDRANEAYQDIQAKYDSSDAGRQSELQPALDAARAAYEAAAALQAELTAEITPEDVEMIETQAQAQADYDTAVTNFIDGITGDNARIKATNLVRQQSQVRLIEAGMFDALQRLNTLKNAPDPDELAAAQARLNSAQALVDLAVLTAPFSGEVIAVYYEAGDLTTPQQPALTLADLVELHITMLVDEEDLTRIGVGNPVTVTFSALPDVEATGQISSISSMGTTVQGLVKYEVQVVLDQSEEEIPLGLTADVRIEVMVEDNVLSVPVAALQRDAQGEFVNVVAADGTVQRIAVESGAVQDDRVAVKGDLQVGDVVELITP